MLSRKAEAGRGIDSLNSRIANIEFGGNQVTGLAIQELSKDSLAEGRCKGGHDVCRSGSVGDGALYVPGVVCHVTWAGLRFSHVIAPN